MFNQCSLEYFPLFRAMIWAGSCPAPGEVVHMGVSYSRSRRRHHDAFCFMPLYSVPFKTA